MRPYVKCLFRFVVILVFANITLIPSVESSIVAVVDSGVDIKHIYLQGHIWINPVDNTKNQIDEDGNNLLDDINGWNFADENNQVMDYSFAILNCSDIQNFFKIQNKSYVSGITYEEREWMNGKLKDQDFVKQVMKYISYIHGTHVAGIAYGENDKIKILPIRIRPTGSSNIDFNSLAKSDNVQMFEFKEKLINVAKKSSLQMKKIANYVLEKNVDVANCSFGTDYEKMYLAITKLLQRVFGTFSNEREVHKFVQLYFETLLAYEQEAVIEAFNTLFVFAAGNVQSNNDQFLTSPANIKAPNALTVAATYGFADFANFSNYGEEMVDLAAPGVSIKSSIPDNLFLNVSGTSQAAPYVSNIAANMKDENPKLMPAELKEILMGTVDFRDYLVGKVKSSGTVNKERAIQAARNTLEMPLMESIELAKYQVIEVKKDKGMGHTIQGDPAFILPLNNFLGL